MLQTEDKTLAKRSGNKLCAWVHWFLANTMIQTRLPTGRDVVQYTVVVCREIHHVCQALLCRETKPTMLAAMACI
jgi:hypothetical protein